MTKTKFIIVGCFCVAFLAGLVAGVAISRPAGRPPHDSWLAHELNLTPEQREKMRQIWSQVAGPPGPSQHEQRQAILKERDEAIRAFLPDDLKPRYEEVMRKYAEKLAALDEARKKAFDQAVERTKQILNESQRKKYEELLQRHVGRHRRLPVPGGFAPGKEPPPPPSPQR